MQEPIDVYSDQFQITMGPYGCVLSFSVSDPIPPSPGSMPGTQRLASIRMSTEHLKAMTFVLRRQIANTESQMGVKAEIPMLVLNQMQISPEDWNLFWKNP